MNCVKMYQGANNELMFVIVNDGANCVLINLTFMGNGGLSSNQIRKTWKYLPNVLILLKIIKMQFTIY